MKFFKLLHLAVKYLWRYRRRYLFLFIALCFGFGIITFITAVKDDMYTNVYNSAQEHYAGDIIAVGYDRACATGTHLTAAEADTILAAIDEAGTDPARIVKRTIFGDNGVLYYNGQAVRLKYFDGVDWQNEKAYFNHLRYQTPLDLDKADDSTIVISAPVADMLGARVGDRIIAEIDTRYGQKNTGVFIVGGIVQDSSIFGYYKAYVSRHTLNSLLLFEPEDCSMVGIYVKDTITAESKREALQNVLSQKLPTGPLTHDRDTLLFEAGQAWDGTKVFLITLPIYLSDIADLLGAMNIITYFLYAMMLVIILVSVMVTYRLLLHERSREIGTMRAIGFHESDIRLVLLVETFGLALVSISAGFVLSLVISWASSYMSFSWFPSFEIFLKDGRLHCSYLPRTVMINVAAILAMMLAATWFPVFKSSRSQLPRLLSGGDS